MKTPAANPKRRGDFSFPRSARIRKRPEFIRLIRSGITLHGRHFIINALPSVGRHSRLGITVTRQVGNAVVRNRMKRLSREYFRRCRHGLTENWDLNIVVKKSAPDLSTAAFFDQLDYVFQKLPHTYR
ncbi:MAG: ribonuclease P protein component [Desulfobacterales bacterium]|nr:MAG: ribonuclease P protein component [Desulfobacterales bacterium]